MLSPNENEEAYIEGCDEGQQNKETGKAEDLGKKYSGEKQRWYIQGYWDGYSDAATRTGGNHDAGRLSYHGPGDDRARALSPVITNRIIQHRVIQLSVMARTVVGRFRRDQRTQA